MIRIRFHQCVVERPQIFVFRRLGRATANRELDVDTPFPNQPEHRLKMPAAHSRSNVQHSHVFENDRDAVLHDHIQAGDQPRQRRPYIDRPVTGREARGKFWNLGEFHRAGAWRAVRQRRFDETQRPDPGLVQPGEGLVVRPGAQAAYRPQPVPRRFQRVQQVRVVAALLRRLH